MADHTYHGGPAFPREDYQADDSPGQRGMSLREYFAGKAMTIVAVAAEHDHVGPQEVADACVEIADALLVALAEPPTERENQKLWGEEQHARAEALAHALRRLYELTAAMDAEIDGARPTDEQLDQALALAKGLLESEDDIPF